MNLHEIEETLHDLQSRHNGLNESLLVTLLRSGGWEEKNIQEAVLLYRSGGSAPVRAPEEGTAPLLELPSTQDDQVLAPPVDENHLLLEHNEDSSNVTAAGTLQPVVSEAEPESLIKSESHEEHPEKDELPHNLPLRPFETSEHIWPFSRYKAVFFGEGEAKKDERPESTPAIIKETAVSKAEEVAVQPIAPVMPAVEQVETISKPYAESAPLVQKEIVSVPMTKGDERLVIIAAIMLVAILMLLGYMYSNGRL